MKKIFCLILAMLSLFALVSCSGSDEAPDGYKLASNADACKYSLFVPENWVTSEGENKTNFTMATVANTDACNVSFSLINDVEAGDSIDAFWEKQVAEYTKLFSDFSALSEKEQVTIGGSVGYRYITTASYGGKTYKFMQVFVPKNEIFTAELYAFTYTAEVSHYDTHLETVNQIISYFKWD